MANSRRVKRKIKTLRSSSPTVAPDNNRNSAGGVTANRDQTIVLSPDEQHAFWNVLNQPIKLTPTQRRLGAMMRGET